MLMWLYRWLATLIYGIAYLCGKAKAASGSELWQGRLGTIDTVGPVDVWLHASSAGEVKVVGYLLSYLGHRNRELKAHITVMTSAGFEAATREFGQTHSVTYFPLDAASAMCRTFEAINPKMLIVAETEIWPNLARIAGKRSVPLILVNGRMTERAFSRYRIVRGFMRHILAHYDRFFFKTEQDAERYRFFGVSENKLQVVGDMKFDAPIIEHDREKRAEIRGRFAIPKDAFLIVAGSTRSGEEVILTEVYKKLRSSNANVVMVLAPRHVDRATALVEELSSTGIDVSVMKPEDDIGGLILVDRMGLLNDLYLAADAAFVGGTFAEIGGHNLLEPVWAGTPVLFGPSVHNVTEAADYITKHNYGAMVADGNSLRMQLERLLAGEPVFDSRTIEDSSGSPAAISGEYILSRFSDA